MHRLGSPYGRCTDGAEDLDVRLLYNASYTMQVRLGRGGGLRGEDPGRKEGRGVLREMGGWTGWAG